MYAIYRDAGKERPFVLRRFDDKRQRPLGREVYRGNDLGEVRNYLAERCTTRLESYERESRHPSCLIELWMKPR